jgi:hypothetical protein
VVWALWEEDLLHERNDAVMAEFQSTGARDLGLLRSELRTVGGEIGR